MFGGSKDNEKWKERKQAYCIICNLPIRGIFDPQLRSAHKRCSTSQPNAINLKIIDGDKIT